jgi:putative ABC transport system permease protein
VAAVSRNVFVGAQTTSGESLSFSANDEPPFAARVLRGDAGPEVFGRGEVLVGAGLARQLRLKPGATLDVSTPTGVGTVTVGAIWDDLNNNGRTVTAPIDMVTALFGPQPAEGVTVRPALGVPLDELAGRILAAGLDPHLEVRLPDEIAASVASDVTSQLDPFWILQRVLLAVAFTAVLSTLLLAGIQRRREMGVLAAVGATPRDLGLMTLVEGGAIGAVGGLLGAIVSVPLLAGIANEGVFLVGRRLPVGYDPVPTVAYLLLGLVVVVAGSIVPAMRSARVPVLDALSYE